MSLHTALSLRVGLCVCMFLFVCLCVMFGCPAVPPEPPVLYDSSGRQIRERAGPFREGQTVTITCVTSGGEPTATADCGLRTTNAD